MEQQDTRGRAKILQAYISSSLSNITVPILNNILSITISEDVYTPYVSCSIVLLDYESVINKFPLAGEEYLYIKFQSYKGREIDFQFLLYKNHNIGATGTNTIRGMELHGVTLEYALDKAKTVTGALRGTHTDIVRQIFKTYIKKDARGLDLSYEPSRGVVKVLPSFWSPLEVIDYCRSRAIASSAMKSPFVFFRNADGYFFRSLNGLFNEMATKPEAKIVHTYAPRPLSATFDERNEVPGARVDIVDYHIDSYYDTMEKINWGAYNTDSYSFDILTKSFILNNRFNLSESGSKFQLGGSGGPYNRQAFAQGFRNTRCSVSYVPTNTATEFDGTSSKDYYPEFVGEKNAYANLLGEYNFRCTIYGDTDITPGQVMAISVPRAQDVDKGNTKRSEQDKMFSGSFLITRIEHVIAFNLNVDYHMRISAVNGARDYTIEGVSDA
jgi:hypothetical protein